MGSIGECREYDAILVGAGFGGYTMLPKLRRLGLRAKIFERGSGSGGVWLVFSSVRKRLNRLTEDCYRHWNQCM